MKDYIKYIPLGLFVAFCLKSLALGVNLHEAPLFAILAVFCAYLIQQDNQNEKSAVESRLAALEKLQEAKSKEIEDLRSHVSSVKLGQQIKSAGRF